MNLALRARFRALINGCRHAAVWLTDTDRYSKQNIFLFMTLLSVLLFWQKIVELYNQYLVSPVWSRITSGPVGDCVFALLDLAVVLFLVAKIRKGYRLSGWQLTLMLGPGLLYAVAHYFNGASPLVSWRFATFQAASRLRYADTLLLLLAGGLLLQGYRIWVSRRAAAASASHLREDNPLTTAADDALGYLPEARRVAQQITTLVSSTSFAIGILGKWGDGKSSFLKLVELNLVGTATIIIHFNPWLVESTAAIRKDFFATLKERLGEYSGELATEIGTYASSLASVYDTTTAKAIKEAATFFLDTPTLTEQFAKVNEVIARLRKKIVIFLDDIDRLDKDEVLETLRLVRNTASFGNTIFVLAYDKQYIINAIHITNQSNSTQYLDKIVQLEIPLPHFNPVVLARHTLKIVRESLQAQVSPQLLNDLQELLIGNTDSPPADTFRQFYATQMRDPKVTFYPEVITNMRGAIRFANLFTFDLLPLAKDVQLDELLNLTLLKFKYPALYEAIKYQRIVKADFDLFNNPGSGSVIKLQPEKLQAFYEAHPGEKAAAELLDRMLKHLFGNNQLPPGERTIQRPSSFAIYFSAGQFENVPLVEIEQLRRGQLADVKPKVASWETKRQLPEAYEIIWHVQEFDNRADFENVVAAVLEAGKRLGQNVSDWLKEINARREQLITGLYRGNEAEFKQFFQQLLVSAEPPYLFEANLAFNIKAALWRRSITDFFLSREELNQLTLSYLSRHLTIKQAFDKDTFFLYQCNGTDVDQQNHIIIYPAASALIRQAITTYLDTALEQFIIPTGQPPLERHLTFRPFLNQIFNSWSAVDAFIDALPNSATARRVQVDYRLFKASGYREFERQLPLP